MTILSGGLIGLKSIVEQLKPSERRAAEYILEHPQRVVQMSVQRLAELCGVSEATIIRLSKSLNMGGFRELKLRIAGDLITNVPTGNYMEIMMGETEEAIIQSVSAGNKQSIIETISVLSADEIRRACDALLAARKIDVYGIGASAVIGLDIKQKFTRINWWCETYDDLHSQLTSAVNLTDQDVAFGISYSGATTEVIQSLVEAKKQGATIITLTKYGSNKVSELADIKLFTSSVEQSVRVGAMASRIAQLNVVDILFMSIANRSQEEIIPMLEKTRLAIKKIRS